MMQANRSRQEHETVEAQAPLSLARMRPGAGPSDLTLRPQQRLTATTPVMLRSDRAGSAPARLWTALTAAAETEADRGLAFLFLPVAMGAGAGLFYGAQRDPGLLGPLCGFAVALILALFAGARHIGLARAGGFAAALFAGAIAGSIEQRSGTVLLDQDVTTGITGSVEAREFDAGGRVRYLIRVISTADPELGRPPERVRLVARAPHPPLPVGAAISGRARLSSPSGPVMPGGYDFAFRAFIDGIGAHGFFYRAPQAADPLAQPPPSRLQAFRHGLRTVREQISARIRSVLPGDPGGIAATLAVSDRRGISEAAVDSLRATGLAHILAISGLHMALAAGTLYMLIRTALAAAPAVVEAWPVKKIAAVGALLAATAYLMISGASVATQRAWVMLVIMLVAVLADRPALTMRNVALAAMAIILLTPSAVVGPGFQMSFAATAALISAYAVLAARKRARQGEPGLLAGSMPGRVIILFVKAILGLAITALVAGLATGLFSAHHFHRLAGNGVLANVLAMPLVTFVVMPAGVLALLLMPFGLDEWPLRLMGKGLEGVIWTAQYVESLGGDIVVGQIPLQATLAASGGLILLVFLRSWLRLGGFALILLGAVLALPPFRDHGPDILISEDGALVALAGPEGLASNAARPSEFLFRQWQTALRDKPHIAPVSLKSAETRTAGSGTESSGTARSDARGSEAQTSEVEGSDAAIDPKILDRLLASAAGERSRFHCASRGICAAIHHRAKIIAIREAALIGAACDRADLVILAIPVRMRACHSGATLVTSRTLRVTGSLAIRMRSVPVRSTASPDHPRTTRPGFTIDASLEGVIRPWTIQRYYDWRSRSYDLPN
ncbi:MAG: ComEC family competence protein [Hoeflea sp.]|uniref:ComEC/Rec2 family competence protein n=1 Tax=Hoeflea sp. TaxID=1940281 RepID=UPI001D392720|nr:ComEC/Rec2 family competence protein [Hoeflea sp.]MBU4529640.1 ComEC family competence protein [Alphaproteobacteria bacterium]MBU4546759.1 ComEC family competence protein [Alphaproteobacteria bacterium]MBU4551027.1 ComEC family competence protein [Alphaproteobacteria bacterium]MBV1723969.1 ComEC family competence protein [Hoeflea sp.]MBV1763246.1 ComEC family competence protein [Hoeflea sp.]